MPYIEVDSKEGQTVATKELTAVAKSLKQNVAHKAAIQACWETFRRTKQKCIDDGRVLNQWKRQVLVLLPKPGKRTGDPTSYQPISLLDTLGSDREDHSG